VHLKAEVIVSSVRWRARRSSRRLVHAIVNCAVLTPASGRTTLNHMVYFGDVLLDRAFAALADPTRRAILDRLAHDSELAVMQIAGRFDVSLPAVIKHLDVLARAGLIERAKAGRTVNCPYGWSQWKPRCSGWRAGRAGEVRGGGSMLTKPSLTLKPRCKASPDQVFSAWADPKKYCTGSARLRPPAIRCGRK
jgi:DNA-binding transcriptional ArsR family regulator